MGRLIDADKLRAKIEAHEIIKNFSITEYECGHNVGLCIGIDEVDEAESVEAIPIPWIEKYIEAAEECDGYAAKIIVGVITGMVDEWKKEG